MLRRIFYTMVVLAATAVPALAGDVMFGYAFKQGDSQRYHLKLSTKMNMVGMDASQVADMTVKVTCSSAAKDAYTMSLLFEKVVASNVIADNTTADPTAAQMTGKTVVFTVDSHGTVSDITPGPGFDVWPQVQQVVEPTLKNWYVYMPAKAVAVGSGWKRENYRDKASSGADYVTNEVFKFRESRKVKGSDVAMVDQDVTTTVGGTTETPMGNFKLSGTGKGKFEFAFNPVNCAITTFTGNMETTIDMTPQSGGAAMKTTVTNHIERELLE